MTFRETVSEQKGIDDLPVVEGIDWNYAWLHLPDMSLLKYTVMEFYEMIEEMANELDEFYQHIEEDGVLNLYCTRVHGMKSTAALIGIIPLAGMAKILEFAAKDKDMERIHAVMPIFLDEWRSYKNKLEGIFN